MKYSQLRALALCLPLVLFISCDRSGPHDEEISFQPVSVTDLHESIPKPAADRFGFLIGRYETVDTNVRRNESLYIILRRHNVSPLEIDYIQRTASEHVNVSRLLPGQDYTLYKRNDKAVGIVWHLNALEYVVMRWENGVDSVTVWRERRELEVRERVVSGTIDRSLYETLLEDGVSTLLGSKLARIFAWQVNFFAIQEGDHFTAVYDEYYVEDRFYGVGEVHAAKFHHRNTDFRAYYFEHGERDGYYDEEGNSLEKALLQAPFEYDQRVSSRFTHNRFHPILQVNRPHYGVDYAAPTGTPIISVGDGVVTEAQYRGGNGNIVQVRHNSVYKTAYLHMSRFASGIRPGATVRQGQVIGYVGQTGLATGPHLCYRLYVNDSPVNSRTVELPASEGLDKQYLPEFNRERLLMDQKLERRSVQEPFATISIDVSGGGRN
ncbi:MAG: peptidoglycan DD-metalloendopeptidase family protein [Balneolaceae bacterium]